jgi:hypothetical protein
MDLVRDVLDKQVRDRQGRKMGKVDGIVLELRDDAPPRVAFLEIGPMTLARRLGSWLGRLAQAIDAGFGVGDGRPLRITLAQVRDIGIEVVVDVDAERTRARAWEQWLRRQVVARIPGSGARS